jgi:hypothetical protein
MKGVSRRREMGISAPAQCLPACLPAKAKAALQGRTYFHPPSFFCLEFEGKTESLSLLSLDPSWLIQGAGSSTISLNLLVMT